MRGFGRGASVIPLRRRDLLGGLAAAVALPAGPAFGRSDGDARLRTLLDGLGDLPDDARRLAGLDAIDPASLSASAAIDLRTVRNGIAIDSQLSRLVPGGKAGPPYRLPRLADGMWRHANGAAAYALLLERHVGDRVDPEAAHRRFEREAARLGARADRLMRAAGLTQGSVGERYRSLFADPRWLYSDDNAGRDAAVADMNRWLDEAGRVASTLVGPVPLDSAAGRVERMSAAEEAAGKGGYRRMTDGIRAGGYVVDLREIRRRPKWSLKSVVHHELIPGHMVQLPIEASAHAHPLRIAYLPAFSEGWAIYAEQLMADHGTYRSAPLEELGHVHWLLFRIVRALIDTGIHHRRWSLDQARAQFDLLQGVPAYFAPFETDLARIAGDPAVRAAEALIWFGITGLTQSRNSTLLCQANSRILANGRKPLVIIPNNGMEV